MSSATEAYFGWSQPGHREGCRRPVWEVDNRIDYGAWRARGEGADHSCPNEDCGHHNEYSALTVRLVCRSCGVVQLFRGELHATETTTTRNVGYGHLPRKVAGLWLYPGSPLLHGDSEPYDYLCAMECVDRLQPGHVVGYLGQGRGRRGGVIWGAAALAEVNETSRRWTGPLLTYAVRSGALTFKTVTAAAKWVRDQVRAAQLATATEDAVGGEHAQSG